MISKELLSEVLGFKITPVNGKELREKSFGYEQGLRTACICPLKDDEWISLSNNIIHFGYVDTCPEVLINIPEGVCTIKKINIHELAHKCKEWASDKGFQLLTSVKDGTGNPGCFIDYTDTHIQADSEPEAIFKACQWVLDNHIKDGRV